MEMLILDGDMAGTALAETLESENLLRGIIAADREPNHDELAHARRFFAWDANEFKKQLRRLQQVTRYQAVAGTPASREAGITERDCSAQILLTESPKLAAKMEAIQKQINALERDHRLASKRCDEQIDGVDQLRKLVPAHVLSEHGAERAAIENKIGEPLRQAVSRASQITACQSPDAYKSQVDYFSALRFHCREAVTEIVENKMSRYRLSDQWPSISAAMTTELAGLKKSIESLQKQYDEKMLVADRKLDFYS